jgi:uncharacterized protein (TIGR02300 family)
MQSNLATATGRPVLGTKRTCVGCNERFYDLNRTPARCPKCSTEQPVAAPRVASGTSMDWRSRRRRPEPVADVDHGPVAEPEAGDEKEAADDDLEPDAEDSEPDTEAEVDPIAG